MHDTFRKKISSFPLLPATVSRVIEVTGDPESSANDLIQTILPDQSICTTILKVANSALYGRPKKVGSLETAVMVLGMNEVRNIVLSHAVVSYMQTLVQKNKTELEAFWDHSFTCGLAARNIAGAMNLQSGDFFIGGLIHDIGKLAMLILFPENYDSAEWMNKFSDISTLIAEKKAFHLNHNDIGHRILERWQFPYNLQSAIGFHHYPLAARPEDVVFSLVIQLADVLAHLAADTSQVSDSQLIPKINSLVPELKSQWQSNSLVWDEVTIESWFAWIIIERTHGSSVLQLFSSQP